jgi:hypothetical protein
MGARFVAISEACFYIATWAVLAASAPLGLSLFFRHLDSNLAADFAFIISAAVVAIAVVIWFGGFVAKMRERPSAN